MGVPISLVLDCADPPEGHESWAEVAAAAPADGIGYLITDPDGTGPSMLFQVVPEPKAAKNRPHIDIRMSQGAPRPSEEERRRIEAGVAPLVELGATVLRRHEDPDDWFVVLQDPEGNEFCLV